MPITSADTASVVIIRQELASIMASLLEIDTSLQVLGVAAVEPICTLDFSKASSSGLIAVISA